MLIAIYINAIAYHVGRHCLWGAFIISYACMAIGPAGELNS